MSLSVISTLLAGLFLIIVVAFEVRKAPWSPFIFGAALYTLVLPFFLTPASFLFGDLVFMGHWHYFLLATFATFFWEYVVCSLGYEKLALRIIGKYSSYFWSPTILIGNLLNSLVISLRTKRAVLAFFFLVWAPIGEEIFFCGYIFQSMRGDFSLLASLAITALMFGSFHAFEFFSVRPYPWPAACVFSTTAIGSMSISCLLFEATNNLLLSIATHFASNIFLLFHQSNHNVST